MISMSLTASAQSLSTNCADGDSIKHICFDDYALLISYAIKGKDYDTVTTLLKQKIDNLNQEIKECDNQQQALIKATTELNQYINTLEKKYAVKSRRLKFSRSINYGAGATIGILLILLFT